MGEFGDKIEFFKSKEAKGIPTQLREMPPLEGDDTFYWKSFVTLHPNITFTETLAWCNYVREPDVVECFTILKHMSGALSDNLNP